jgi:hypothetical protein
LVNLDFCPGSPVRLLGGDQPYPEISTIPSEIEQLQQSAGDVAARLPALHYPRARRAAQLAAIVIAIVDGRALSLRQARCR